MGDARASGTVAQAELMLRTPVDCVMLDLGLPDAAGLDALHRISRRVEDVPIIVLTGDGDGRRGVEAVAAGAQDYLVKGEVDPPTLRRAIRYGIERCRAEASERKLHDAELQARESARLERGLLPRPVVSDPRSGCGQARGQAARRPCSVATSLTSSRPLTGRCTQ